MSEKLHTLIHQPRGNEHPYKRKPFERSPRDPVAGDEILLGAITRPPGAAQQVWVEWKAGQQEWQKLPAINLKTNDQETTWQARFPAFAADQCLLYRFCAQQDEQRLCSPEFELFIPGWRQPDRVTSVAMRGRQVNLSLGGLDGEAQAALTLSQIDANHLQIQWCWGSIIPETTGTGVDHPKFELVQNEGTIELLGQGLHIVINREPFRLNIITANGRSLLEQVESPRWLVGRNNNSSQVAMHFNSPEDEAFYGFGERFNQLNQRGQVLDVRVYEAYKNQGRLTYIPMPLHVSSKGYGLVVNTNRYVSYDLAAADPRIWSMTAELNDGALSYDIITADHPWKIVSQMTRFTAQPSLPPAWAFGPWMSGNDWNNQDLVMEQVRLTMEHGIPATVLVIEAWSDEATFYIWNEARYEPRSDSTPFGLTDFDFPEDGLWPDPKKMIDELHDSGLKVILWQIPALKTPEWIHDQSAHDKAHMIDKGYCVHEADGSPYKIRPFWFHDDLLLDVTNEEALEWWLDKRAYLLDEMGVDGFKTDGGEHMWGRDLQFSDGRSGAELWNLYPNLYVGAYYQFANEKRAEGAIIFSRAGYTGAQAFPCHWAGDENSTWPAFRASITAGLNAGISGIPFWGWDIGGFSGEIPSAELYLRSTAMATFCPIMQYHSEYNGRQQPSRDRTPWNIQERTGDDDVIPIFRRYANLRMNLLPYILSEAHYSSILGLPMMRALPLEYPDDPRCREYPYQYMFGRSLLVAPVVEPGQDSWQVYLPQGRWFDFWTGQGFDGRQTIDVVTGKGHIPVFVMQGSILPLNLDATFAIPSSVGNRIDGYKNLCFKVFGEEGAYDWFDSLSENLIELQIKYDAPRGQWTCIAPKNSSLIGPILEIGPISIFRLQMYSQQAQEQDS